MADDTKFKTGDEVYVKSLDRRGKVLSAREPEEDRFYEVQIIHFCRPSDLEHYDPDAALKKRDLVREKLDRLAVLQRRMEETLRSGGVPPALAMEFAVAASELGVALGCEPLLIKKE